MASNGKPAYQDQIQRIRREIEEIDIWAKGRIIAYRFQRDLWQRLTYALLAISALTAIGAAISAGLKVQLWTIIFASLSAGLSVINASLKSPTQVTKSETALAIVGSLRAKIKAFMTDLPDLSTQNATRRLEQCRKDYEQALKLPSPSYVLLARAANTMENSTPIALTLMSSIMIGIGSNERKSLLTSPLLKNSANFLLTPIADDPSHRETW